MQCVIIAAGKGTRMQPLTFEKPKPLVEVCGTPLIEHIVTALPEVVTELIIVIGYKGEMIREYCGREYLGRTVTYCEQSDYAGGTGDALMCAKELITEKFLFMYADDIHGAEAIAEAVEEDHAMLGAQSDHPQDFGVLMTDGEGMLTQIVEKPTQPPSSVVNIGGFVLQPDIFDYLTEASAEHGEVFVTDMVTDYAKKHAVRVIEQDRWIPVGKPEDIVLAESILCPDSIESKD